MKFVEIPLKKEKKQEVNQQEKEESKILQKRTSEDTFLMDSSVEEQGRAIPQCTKKFGNSETESFLQLILNKMDDSLKIMRLGNLNIINLQSIIEGLLSVDFAPFLNLKETTMKREKKSFNAIENKANIFKSKGIDSDKKRIDENDSGLQGNDAKNNENQVHEVKHEDVVNVSIKEFDSSESKLYFLKSKGEQKKEEMDNCVGFEFVTYSMKKKESKSKK